MLHRNNTHVLKEIQPVRPQDVHAVRKYCVGKHEGQLYPGLIKDIDETDTRVQCTELETIATTGQVLDQTSVGMRMMTLFLSHCLSQ